MGVEHYVGKKSQVVVLAIEGARVSYERDGFILMDEMQEKKVVKSGEGVQGVFSLFFKYFFV